MMRDALRPLYPPSTRLGYLVLTLALGLPSCFSESESPSPAEIPAQELFDGVLATPAQSGPILGKPGLLPIIAIEAPERIALGQNFEMNFLSNFPPGAGNKSASVVLHEKDAPVALLLAGSVKPAPFGALGAWRTQVRGLVPIGFVDDSQQVTFEVALLDASGQIGQVSMWQVQVDASTTYTCPQDQQCGERSCGADPICGIACGNGACPPKQICTYEGLCHPLGSVCPDAADCRGRQCGLDPYCDEPCGAPCPAGFACSPDGLCESNGTTGTSTGSESTSSTTTSTGDSSDETSTDDASSNEDTQSEVDSDNDGVLDHDDCAPADPTVGSTAQKDCTNPAGCSGQEKCVSGQWFPCDAPAECSCRAGEMQTIKCGNCGSRDQKCEAGIWKNVGECYDQGSCSPGITKYGAACGNCGTLKSTCLASCEWDTPVCSGEGECKPALVENNQVSCDGVCGSFKTQSRTCSATCSWEPWSEFGDCSPGVGCKPGNVETDTDSCGWCGTKTRDRTCSDACDWGTWGTWSSCKNVGVCDPTGPAQVEDASCGNCGTKRRSRTCKSSCEWDVWSEWTKCIEPTDSCKPGTTKTSSQSCGNCGTQDYIHTCSNECGWGPPKPSGTCKEAPGSCEKGKTETKWIPDFDGCGLKREQSRTCPDGCGWTEWKYTGNTEGGCTNPSTPCCWKTNTCMSPPKCDSIDPP